MRHLLIRVGIVALSSTSCGTRFAETAELPSGPGDASGGSTGGGSAGGRSGSSVPCPASLAARLTLTDVSVDDDIRYKRFAYDFFPADERVALAVGPNGAAQVAWLDNTLQTVHVTPLTPDGLRAEQDLVVSGNDLGGLVVRDDGFAVLTRRDDPGEPLSDPAARNAIAKAALLVRFRDGREAFAAPLTGTAQIDESLTNGRRRDCAATPLLSRLAFDGSRYGAYFVVHGCTGHPKASFYADKLSYVDDSGAHRAGGWAWNCSINQGLRLLPGAGPFTPFCLSDGAPYPGLNLVIEGKPPVHLSRETVEQGYSAAQFGSVVRMGDGRTLVGWLSRGFGSELKRAPDMAILQLDSDYTPQTGRTWLAETPTIAETNLHLAPYGPDRLLVVWDSIETTRCDEHTCFGTYTGTHLRLIDPDGNFLTEDEVLPVPPNSEDDIAVFPNGDLGWAFVPEETRSYAMPLTTDRFGVPRVPAKRQLRVARLRYCP